MDPKGETKEMKELEKKQMETVNAGKIIDQGFFQPPISVTDPRCKYCGCDLKNVGGFNYKCVNDDCSNFGAIVNINDI